MHKKLVVVADDFTGANDTGVQFRKAGLKVNVIINTSDLSRAIEQCDVVVIDLESRMVSAVEAYKRNFSVGKQLFKIGDYAVYKKLDSTFRGNIGAEIDGLMDGMQLKCALLAAALPVYGRTIENGEVYVNKIKLADTEVGRDPRSPVKHSRVVDMIRQQSKRACCEISTRFFNSEADERKDFLLKEMNKGSEIFIFDSREEVDLENIAHAIDGIDYTSFLLAGSAGLANHLSKLSFLHRKPLAFVFAGSTSEKTRSQIMYTLQQDNVALITIDGAELLNESYKADGIIEKVSMSINGGTRRFIFTSALSNKDVAKVFEIAKQRSRQDDEAAGKVSHEMGKLAAALIKKFNPSGVLLTGGETAINTVNALGATGIEIDREILPGIQSGTLTGCSVKSVIVTKAGGFGEQDAISTIFEFFKV